MVDAHYVLVVLTAGAHLRRSNQGQEKDLAVIYPLFSQHLQREQDHGSAADAWRMDLSCHAW